jgi:hypothetical protein
MNARSFRPRMTTNCSGVAFALVLLGCASTTSHQTGRGPAVAVDRVVTDAGVEKTVVQALDDIALGRGEYHRHLSVPFMIGPALWGEMLSLDPTLAAIGTESTSVVPMGEGTRVWKMGGFLDEDAVRKIGRHIKLRAVAESFRAGEVRPATPEERKLFYALTPLEIAGKPLTVLCVPRDQPAHRLAVFAEKGRLVWIDLLSGYSEGSR